MNDPQASVPKPNASVPPEAPAKTPSAAAAEAEALADPVLKQYADRAAARFTSADELGARSRSVSNFRGLCFGLAVIFGVAALVGKAVLLWGSIAALLLVVFFGLVVWHSRIIEAEQMALRWVQVNRDAIKRNGSRFRDLPEDGARFSNALHPYADDLDLFGPASLFQRMCTARTQFGQQRLAAFLMNRAPVAEVAARQEAARELVPLLDVRQELEALALAVVDPLGAVPSVEGGGAPAEATPKPASQRATPTLDPEPLLAWAEREPGLSGKLSVVIVAWVMPCVTVGVMFGAWLFGWHPLTWMAPLVLQALFLLTARVHTSAVFAAVSAHQGLFLRFGPMLKLLEQLSPNSERLKELQRDVQSAEGQLPSQAMQSFERIVSWWEVRHNGLVYPVINGVLLWDVHCVLRLEAWQRQCGKRLRRWFQALGELEALASLASFAHDNPSYVWPKVVEGHAHFRAKGLGHPLLAKTHRVTNDVALDGPSSALLVTGSNMSGKSTLLRSMGINSVLALAGSAVAASEFEVSPLAVRTSMRIRDSLDQGVSHFYAELRKLKSVLDSVRGPAPVLFLLDEVLHGTNSRERQIGARWVIAELLRHSALGAVSTHDSGLCELPPELMNHVTQVHLRELAQGGELVFDYKLYPGPVQSGNALRLMRSIGIDVPLE